MSISARRRQGFTVVELLAITSVIAALGLMFSPAWIKSRADSRNARCAESLSNIGRAVQLYSTEHDDRLPGCQHTPPSWVESLQNYTSPARFICPEEAISVTKDAKAPKWSYALNDFLTSHPYGARDLDFSKHAAIPAPAQTLAFAETAYEFRAYDHFHFADAKDNGHTPERFAEQVDIERHGGSANYLFVDGHVEGLGWNSAAKEKLNVPGSRFVHPAGGKTPRQFARN